MMRELVIWMVGMTMLAGAHGCAPQLSVSTIKLPTSGKSLDYTHYRSSTEGCGELVTREVYDWDGRLVDSKHMGAETPACALLRTTIESGSRVGAAAALRPDRFTNNENN